MPQGMEPDTKKYLIKVLNSLFAGMLWLLLNATGGLYFEFAIIKGKLSLPNVLFFTWFIASLLLLLYYYFRLWRE